LAESVDPQTAAVETSVALSSVTLSTSTALVLQLASTSIRMRPSRAAVGASAISRTAPMLAALILSVADVAALPSMASALFVHPVAEDRAMSTITRPPLYRRAVAVRVKQADEEIAVSADRQPQPDDARGQQSLARRSFQRRQRRVWRLICPRIEQAARLLREPLGARCGRPCVHGIVTSQAHTTSTASNESW
jgi:hypothetical protein